MFKDISPFGKLVIALILVFAIGSAFFILGAVLAIPFFNFNFFTDSALLNSAMAENLAVVKYFQILNSLGMFVVPPLVIAKLYSGEIRNYLCLNNKTHIKTYLLTGIATFAALPLIAFSAEVNANLVLPESLQWLEDWMRSTEEYATEVTVALLQMNSFQDFLINLLMIAVIPAFGEELLFRGVFQKILIEWMKKPLVPILITAFFFSAFHMQFLTFLPRFLLGIFLGYLLVWTNTIWVPVLAHFLNNASAVVYYYVADVDIAKDMTHTDEPQFPLFVVLLAIAAFLVLLRFIMKQEAVSRVPD